MKAESKQYLQDNIYILDALKQDVKKHLSDNQADKFLAIAREIKPGINFQVRECQDCIDSLVLFVFRAFERSEKRMTFPKHEPLKAK